MTAVQAIPIVPKKDRNRNKIRAVLQPHFESLTLLAILHSRNHASENAVSAVVSVTRDDVATWAPQPNQHYVQQTELGLTEASVFMWVSSSCSLDVKELFSFHCDSAV